jgi:hypothetical protein
LLDCLPRNLNIDICRRKEQLHNKNSVGMKIEGMEMNVPLETLTEEQWEEGDEYEGEQKDDEGLVVAWQYKKDVQQQRLGLSSPSQYTTKVDSGAALGRRSIINKHHAAVYCHSYNLQGRLKDQIDIDSRVTIVPIRVDARINSTTNGVTFYQQLVSAVVTATKASINDKEPRIIVARILLYHPDTILCAFALPLLLHYIRKHKLPAIVLVVPVSSSMPTDTCKLHHIQRCSDVVLATESFTMRHLYPPPVEFRHLHGLLHVLHTSTTHMSISGHFADRTIQRSPIAMRYGLHRDRRKLNMSLLHIPPENYATDGGSVSSGAVRSGAGRTAVVSGCSVVDGNSALDF